MTSDYQRWLRSLALVAVLALAACGDEDDNGDEGVGDARPEETVAAFLADASPAAGTPARGEIPQDANAIAVTVSDGALDPDTIDAQVGLPLVLTVTGDGTAHTLEIEELVAETQVAANGETAIPFTLPEGTTGDHTILLDGEDAGTLRVTGAGGGID